jgi:hypothetical protein
MRGIRTVLATTTAALALTLIPAPKVNAQVSVSIGTAPECPYGYYDYAPYNCAPYGYYGPEWFTSGVFVGAGPWFHGGHDFHGSVNRKFDPRMGYHGSFPQHGSYHAPADNFHSFQASHTSDGHGHFSNAPHGGGSHGHGH